MSELVPEVEDGYPTDATLECIQKWDCVGKEAKLALMKYISQAWWMPSFGWSQEDFVDDFGDAGVKYSLSTGGWSGNEDLIGAMQKNFLFWGLSWVQSRRGGHYIFEVTC